MLTNYLKIACRQLIRQKVYSIINILGWPLAWPARLYCSCLYGWAFIWQAQFKIRSNIYCTNSHQLWGKEIIDSYSPLPLERRLKDEYPTIEAYARITQTRNIYFVDQKRETIGEENMLMRIRIFQGIWLQIHLRVSRWCAGRSRHHRALRSMPGNILEIKTCWKDSFTKRRHFIRLKGVFKDLPWILPIAMDALITSHNLPESFGAECIPFFQNLQTMALKLISFCRTCEISDIAYDLNASTQNISQKIDRKMMVSDFCFNP